MNEKMVMCEIELNNVLCVKNAYIPSEINKHDFILANEAIRQYFHSLGYENIGYVKII